MLKWGTASVLAYFLALVLLSMSSCLPAGLALADGTDFNSGLLSTAATGLAGGAGNAGLAAATFTSTGAGASSTGAAFGLTATLAALASGVATASLADAAASVTTTGGATTTGAAATAAGAGAGLALALSAVTGAAARSLTCLMVFWALWIRSLWTPEAMLYSSRP